LECNAIFLEARLPAGLIFDAAGNLYGTASRAATLTAMILISGAVV